MSSILLKNEVSSIDCHIISIYDTNTNKNFIKVYRKS